SDAEAGTLKSTTVEKNVTQILRKVVAVSDTADALSSYGRGSELAYQMEKAGAEIKRDLEWAFLNNGAASEGLGALTATNAITTAGTPPVPNPVAAASLANSYNGLSLVQTGTTGQNGARVTAGFKALVSTQPSPDAIQGTVTVVKDTAGTGLTETDLFGLTEALYEAGAQPNIIMFHPS
ncbi:DUF5309 domain-containing protein, partial [Herbiconiux daphne]